MGHKSNFFHIQRWSDWIETKKRSSLQHKVTRKSGRIAFIRPLSPPPYSACLFRLLPSIRDPGEENVHVRSHGWSRRSYHPFLVDKDHERDLVVENWPRHSWKAHGNEDGWRVRPSPVELRFLCWWDPVREFTTNKWTEVTTHLLREARWPNC